MEFIKKLKQTQSTNDQEKLDEARYRTEGECLREGVYLKKKVKRNSHEISYEYRDGEREVWLSVAKPTEIAGAKVVLLWSETWCSIVGDREPITEELRKQILKDLRKSAQGPFVDRSAQRE